MEKGPFGKSLRLRADKSYKMGRVRLERTEWDPDALVQEVEELKEQLASASDDEETADAGRGTGVLVCSVLGDAAALPAPPATEHLVPL